MPPPPPSRDRPQAGATSDCPWCGPAVPVAVGTHDVVIGMGGGDMICGGDGEDEIYSYTGADRLFGGTGSDFIASGEGDDLLEGGGGNDSLVSAEGRDELRGGSGLDWLEGGIGGDLMAGGAGVDEVVYARTHDRVVVDLRRGFGANNGNATDGREGSRDALRSLEVVYGSPARDTLRGNGRANVLIAGGGRDSVFGGRGNDLIDVADFSADPSIETADRADCGQGRDTVLLNRGIDRPTNCEVKAVDEREAARSSSAPAWTTDRVQPLEGSVGTASWRRFSTAKAYRR